MDPLPAISLLGVPLHRVTAAEAVEHVFATMTRGQGGWMFTPNLDILRRLTTDVDYAAMTAPASLRLADGMPLVWASRLQGTPLPERVAGSEIIWPLCRRAAQEGRTVYFLGGNPGAAEGAARILSGRDPSLRVAGIECPPLGFENDPAYLAALESRLRDADPDLCLLGLPALKQDRLIARLLPLMPRTWFAGIGVTFSFITGEVRKPPVLIRRVGLEWFYRFLQEPRRLARRYLLEGIPFAASLFVRSFLARFAPHLPISVHPDAAPDPKSAPR